jgi:indole-3-glycerol phosphate synthase
LNVLERIMAVKRAEVAGAKALLPPAKVKELAARAAPVRGFVDAIRQKTAAGQPAVVAEIKRASPSRGVLRERFVPEDIARSYERGGAACLSVLTDRQFFQGAPEHLQAARGACTLPVLRKDFVFDPYQVHEARAMGADCILLIAACLRVEEMQALEETAQALGMAVLVEVHDAAELQSALQLRTPLLGINNRDLRTFAVDLATTERLADDAPDDVTLVAESGIRTRADVERLRRAGAHAVLVGETLMRAPDRAAAVRELLG